LFVYIINNPIFAMSTCQQSNITTCQHNNMSTKQHVNKAT